MSINFSSWFCLPLALKENGLSRYGGVISFVRITNLENVNIEVLPPRIDILHYLIPLWHVSQTSSFLLKCFLPLIVWILFVMEFLGMAFPKYVLIYLFGKPIASSYSLELLCIIV